MLFVLFVCLGPAVWADLAGLVRVIDADTIDVGDVRVRLHGIDAPEMGQPCSAFGRTHDCGKLARDVVVAMFEGHRASCRQVDTDRYGRVVASCQLGGRDMGAVIVNDGWAWAYRRYSDAYDLFEKSAAVAERGLWAFNIDRPSDYRAGRLQTAAAPDPDCVIKGNISANGRIYHLPGAVGYDRTSINTRTGERWFCSEIEARAAGWRAVRK